MTDLPDYACQSHQLSCKVLRDEIAQLRARVAELEGVLTQIAGMTSIAHGNHAAYVAADALRAGPMKESSRE